MTHIYKHFIIKDENSHSDGFFEVCSHDDNPSWPIIKYIAVDEDDTIEETAIYLSPSQVPFLIEALQEFLEDKNG